MVASKYIHHLQHRGGRPPQKQAGSQLGSVTKHWADRAECGCPSTIGQGTVTVLEI